MEYRFEAAYKNLLSGIHYFKQFGRMFFEHGDIYKSNDHYEDIVIEYQKSFAAHIIRDCAPTAD